MGKKRATARPEPVAIENRASVTPERFARLCLLLTLLAKAPQTREVLARKLKLDVRGFYRDLEVLRQAGIGVVLDEGRYHLSGPFNAAQRWLPFPDPMLTLGEVAQLARGRSPAHRHLKRLLEQHRG
jgi:hypothetical protein